MKKILSILLCVCMLFSIVACNKDAKDDKSNDNTIIIPDDSSNYDENQEPDGSGESTDETDSSDSIRKNGEFTNRNDMTDEEEAYYCNLMVHAVLELDMPVLEEYLTEDSYTILKNINDNETYRDMYQKTIGKMIYLEESEAFVTRDVNYVFAKWYTDRWLSKAETIKDVLQLTSDEIVDAYEKYYKDAPYTAGELGEYSVKIDNGFIKYDINGIFRYVHVYNILYLDPTSNYDGNRLARLVFADEGECLNLGYNYIDGKVGIWKFVYDFDVDNIMTYIQKNQGNYNYHTYVEVEDYFTNTETAQIINDWVKKNCEIYRTLDCLYIFTDAHIDLKKEIYNTFPYKSYTKEEREMIKELELGQSFRVGSGDELSPFYEIIKLMKSLDVLN